MAHSRFAAAKGGLSYWEAVRRSKDPPTFLVLFEDSAALFGLAIALLGTFAAQYLGDPLYDGLASIAIGLLLAGVGAVIARETKDVDPRGGRPRGARGTKAPSMRASLLER